MSCWETKINPRIPLQPNTLIPVLVCSFHRRTPNTVKAVFIATRMIMQHYFSGLFIDLIQSILQYVPCLINLQFSVETYRIIVSAQAEAKLVWFSAWIKHSTGVNQVFVVYFSDIIIRLLACCFYNCIISILQIKV